MPKALLNAATYLCVRYQGQRRVPARELAEFDVLCKGKYFGEKPKQDIKKAYCDRFCDVCKNPQQTALAKKALDPVEVVASQLAAIQEGVDQDYSEPDESPRDYPDKSRSRSTTASIEDLRNLPGFAKASDLQKNVQSKERDEAYSMEPIPPRIHTESESMEEEPPELVWKPMRRPSKLAKIVDDDDVEGLDGRLPSIDAVEAPLFARPSPITRSPIRTLPPTARVLPVPEPLLDIDDDEVMIIDPPPRAPSPMKRVTAPISKRPQGKLHARVMHGRR